MKISSAPSWSSGLATRSSAEGPTSTPAATKTIITGTRSASATGIERRPQASITPPVASTSVASKSLSLVRRRNCRGTGPREAAYSQRARRMTRYIAAGEDADHAQRVELAEPPAEAGQMVEVLAEPPGDDGRHEQHGSPGGQLLRDLVLAVGDHREARVGQRAHAVVQHVEVLVGPDRVVEHVAQLEVELRRVDGVAQLAPHEHAHDLAELAARAAHLGDHRARGRRATQRRRRIAVGTERARLLLLDELLEPVDRLLVAVRDRAPGWSSIAPAAQWACRSVRAATSTPRRSIQSVGIWCTVTSTCSDCTRYRSQGWSAFVRGSRSTARICPGTARPSAAAGRARCPRGPARATGRRRPAPQARPARAPARRSTAAARHRRPPTSGPIAAAVIGRKAASRSGPYSRTRSTSGAFARSGTAPARG